MINWRSSLIFTTLDQGVTHHALTLFALALFVCFSPTHFSKIEMQSSCSSLSLSLSLSFRTSLFSPLITSPISPLRLSFCLLWWLTDLSIELEPLWLELGTGNGASAGAIKVRAANGRLCPGRKAAPNWAHLFRFTTWTADRTAGGKAIDLALDAS